MWLLLKDHSLKLTEDQFALLLDDLVLLDNHWVVEQLGLAHPFKLLFLLLIGNLVRFLEKGAPFQFSFAFIRARLGGLLDRRLLFTLFLL